MKAMQRRLSVYLDANVLRFFALTLAYLPKYYYLSAIAFALFFSGMAARSFRLEHPKVWNWWSAASLSFLLFSSPVFLASAYLYSGKGEDATVLVWTLALSLSVANLWEARSISRDNLLDREFQKLRKKSGGRRR